AATKFSVLNTIEIDWANSNWESVSVPQLAISAALNTTEVERIFTALPVVSGKDLNLFFCDGFANANRSIAAAKGWSVHNTPILTTDVVTSITKTSAVCGGNITESVGSTVSARGVCRNTTGNPTIANPTTAMGSGTGTFSGTISGLVANTTYYVRAYATNSLGTAYGEQRIFTTLP
ncbi:MAG TPA: hypothetical protein VLH16_02120, partial [Bacteroidales bacterium]|nr:hypothetical protein [Bacteroidales bacterium]